MKNSQSKTVQCQPTKIKRPSTSSHFLSRQIFQNQLKNRFQPVSGARLRNASGENARSKKRLRKRNL